MKKLFFVLIASAMFVGCAVEKPLYTWYNSEDASYTYTKKQTDKALEKAMEQYEKVIKKQKGSRKVAPPGVNAEYGFLLIKANKKEEGLSLLHAEMDTYPESKVFISRIIKQLEK